MTYPYNSLPSNNPQNITLRSPVGIERNPRDPTAQDNVYPSGTIWQNTVTNDFWINVSSTIAGAVWKIITGLGTGTVSFLSGNDNVLVGPDAVGDIHVVGGTDINVTGNPGANTLTIDFTGQFANPAAFYAYLSAPSANATGDGTAFTIPYNTVLYNVGTAFNTGANSFVAPVAGVYTFTAAVDLTNLDPTHTDYQINLVVTGTYAGTYLMNEADSAAIRPGTNTITINSSIQMDMGVSDTAQVQVVVSGGGKTVGVDGGTPNATGYFVGVFNQGISGGGGTKFDWVRLGASQALVPNFGYICVSPGGALVLPLPATSSLGDVIEVVLRGATSWQITQGAGQQIFIGGTSTTLGAGGSLSSTNQGDWVRLVCDNPDLEWQVVGFSGNLVIA